MDQSKIEEAIEGLKKFATAIASVLEAVSPDAGEKPKSPRKSKPPVNEDDEDEEEEETEKPAPKKSRRSKAPKAIDMAALRNVARQILDAGHGDKLKEVLADEFSVKRVSDLEEDDYEEAHKSLTQILEDE